MSESVPPAETRGAETFTAFATAQARPPLPLGVSEHGN